MNFFTYSLLDNDDLIWAYETQNHVQGNFKGCLPFHKKIIDLFLKELIL